VLPALLAWGTLLLPVWTGLRMQAGTLVACYAFNRTLSRVDPLPTWLVRLRGFLTAVAATSLVIASIV
jgi:hypothetical protein